MTVKKTGFVFYVDETGRSGKIISLQQTELPWYQAAKRDKPQKMGLENEKLGLINLVKLRHNEGWHEKFPAFAWCADLGEGWYLPSVGEWQEISRQSKVLNNAMITFPGAHDIAGIYWSSNEDSTHEQRAWSATHYGGSASMQKTDVNKVRAVANFKLDVNAATNTPAQKVNRTHKRTTATQTATAKTYKVGDYYNDGTKEGVVFWVDATGKHGKIVSLDQEKLRWGDKKIVVGATSEKDGKVNTDKVMARADRAEYPAFVWCRNKGKDWYLPGMEELKLLLLEDSVYDAVNKTLESQGEMKMNTAMYLSSTERDKLCVWSVYKRFGITLDCDKDYSSCHVRAVANFKLDANATTNTPAQKVSQTPKMTTATTITTAKTYKAGDYYNDGTKEGVVFWVDATGKHGKIVSHKQVRLQWCTEAQYDKKIEVGATSKTDGKANTDKVMARADRAEYPAFVWSRNRGNDWYLPAIEELELLLLDDSVRNSVNKTLESRGAMRMKSGYFYWSSTESWDISATAVNMIDGSTDHFGIKYDDYYVCAVATF